MCEWGHSVSWHWSQQTAMNLPISYCYTAGASRYRDTAEIQALVQKLLTATVWKHKGAAKNRVKTHLASLCLPTWMERQWNCSPVMQHRGFGARGSLLDQLSLSNTSIPYQSDGFSWAVLTHHCPLHGPPNSAISTEVKDSMAKLAVSPLVFTSFVQDLQSHCSLCNTEVVWHLWRAN